MDKQRIPKPMSVSRSKNDRRMAQTFRLVNKGNILKITQSNTPKLILVSNKNREKVGFVEAHLAVDIVLEAIDVFGDQKKAIGWLNHPHHLLDGLSPKEMLEKPKGMEHVSTILQNIRHGIFS